MSIILNSYSEISQYNISNCSICFHIKDITFTIHNISGNNLFFSSLFMVNLFYLYDANITIHLDKSYNNPDYIRVLIEYLIFNKPITFQMYYKSFFGNITKNESLMIGKIIMDFINLMEELHIYPPDSFILFILNFIELSKNIFDNYWISDCDKTNLFTQIILIEHLLHLNKIHIEFEIPNIIFLNSVIIGFIEYYKTDYNENRMNTFIQTLRK